MNSSVPPIMKRKLPARIAARVETEQQCRNTKDQQDIAVFEPTTLPSARPGTPSSTDLTEISSSGAEVPKATTVRLTIRAGMPRRRLRLTAPLTRNVAGQKQDDQAQAGDKEFRGSRDQSCPFLQLPTRTAAQVVTPALGAQARFRQAALALPPALPMPGMRRRPNMASTAMKIRKRLTILSITRGPNRDQWTRSSIPAARFRRQAARRNRLEDAALWPVAGEARLLAVKRLLHLGHDIWAMPSASPSSTPASADPEFAGEKLRVVGQAPHRGASWTWANETVVDLGTGSPWSRSTSSGRSGRNGSSIDLSLPAVWTRRSMPRRAMASVEGPPPKNLAEMTPIEPTIGAVVEPDVIGRTGKPVATRGGHVLDEGMDGAASFRRQAAGCGGRRSAKIGRGWPPGEFDDEGHRRGFAARKGAFDHRCEGWRR